MRKVFKTEDLCCPKCSADIQDAVSKLPGVKSCSVNFLAEKFTLETEDDADFDKVFAAAKKVFKKIEPDASIIE